MKKGTLLFLAGFTSLVIQAQETRLNLYGSYVFDDKVESYIDGTNFFQGTIQGGLLWGGSIEFNVDDFGLELMYLRQDTEVPVRFYDVPATNEKQTTLDMGINWIMVGGTRKLIPDKQIEPYVGGMMGIAVIDASNPHTQTSATATKFAWGIRMGTNFWISQHFGIKVQGQMLCATQAAGGDLYFSAGGSGSAITAYSSMLQFSLGGGLTYKLSRGGKAKPPPVK